MLFLLAILLVAFYVHISNSMALLRTGSPLDWMKAKPYLNSVRKSGVLQFIHHYKRVKDIQTPLLLWGDELEYGVFAYNNSSKAFDLSLRGTEIRENLSSLEKQLDTKGDHTSSTDNCSWQPEYGAWMVEAVPGIPFGGSASDLLQVEKSMHLRRARLHSALKANEVAPSLSVFPMLGVEGYGHTTPTRGPVSNSESVSDDIINPHPRFGALTRNIRLRRGRNVKINVPKEITTGNNDGDTISMDAMGYGMGCCCLQVTLQCQNETESRFIHDQMVVLAPLFLALSAATPAIRGELLSTDTRWDIISQAVDDRTPFECGESESGGSLEVDVDLVGGGVRRLPKSRYSSVCRYISKAETESQLKRIEQLNDVDAGCDDEVLSLLLGNGIDSTLAHHLAYLFTRDPLVIFDDAIYVDDSKTLEHFENIQSTNWQSVRWKAPVIETGLEIEALSDRSSDEQIRSIANSKPGWRVEFRPLEIQLSDFDNAAFAIVITLAIRAILHSRVDYSIKMSKNEENFKRSHKKDAVITERFHVRNNIFSGSEGGVNDDVEMSLDNFFNGYQMGSARGFKGLMPLIDDYLVSTGCDRTVVDRLAPYLNLIRDKASGKVPTTARVIRDFVKGHRDYVGDGRVVDSICNDLLVFTSGVGTGTAKSFV